MQFDADSFIFLKVVINIFSSLSIPYIQFFRDLKGQFSFQFQRKAMPKNAQTTTHASKVMLKILQARLQQYVNRDLPDVQAGFRKGRGTRDQIANIRWIMEKAREFQKNIYSCFIDYTKAFDYVDHCGKFFKKWEYQTTWPASWETYMQVGKQQFELDMEKQTGSK